MRKIFSHIVKLFNVSFEVFLYNNWRGFQECDKNSLCSHGGRKVNMPCPSPNVIMVSAPQASYICVFLIIFTTHHCYNPRLVAVQ